MRDGGVAPSYANPSIHDAWTTQITNMVVTGNTAFRLPANSITYYGASQSYLFDPNISPTNFFRLEMVGGVTNYRTDEGAQGNGFLTIGSAPGSGASMLCRDTKATVNLPFTCNGELSIVNSTLTFESPATLNGELVIDVEKLPENGPCLVAENDFAFGPQSVLRFTGALPKNAGPFIIANLNGAASRPAKILGVPPDYAVKYDRESPGSISLVWAPSSFFMIK